MAILRTLLQLIFIISGDHKVVWLKGRDVLSAGPILLSRDNRYKLQPTSNGLELNQIRPQDAGDFVCQLQIVGETLEVTHTVEVLGKLVSSNIKKTHKIFSINQKNIGCTMGIGILE